MILLAGRIKNGGMEVSGQKMAFDPARMFGSLRDRIDCTGSGRVP